jgi:urease accessory protein UreF
MTELATHPLAEIFPLIDEDSFVALKNDIAAHGLHEPIWFYEGQILDGRHRYRACRELELDCPTRSYTGDDPLGFMLSMNLQRRHLNESQRAMVAAKIATMRQGERTDVEPSANLQKVSQGQAAKLLNVSTRSVTAAHKVRTEAQPEVVRAVESGTMAVSAAATLAEKPVDVQRRVVNVLTSGAATSVPAALRKMAPAPASHLTRAEAEFDRRLAQTCQYFAMVEQSKLIEALGRRFAEEDVGRWEQALERLGAITKQLAARLLQACRERQ